MEITCKWKHHWTIRVLQCSLYTHTCNPSLDWIDGSISTFLSEASALWLTSPKCYRPDQVWSLNSCQVKHFQNHLGTSERLPCFAFKFSGGIRWSSANGVATVCRGETILHLTRANSLNPFFGMTSCCSSMQWSFLTDHFLSLASSLISFRFSLNFLRNHVCLSLRTPLIFLICNGVGSSRLTAFCRIFHIGSDIRNRFEVVGVDRWQQPWLFLFTLRHSYIGILSHYFWAERSRIFFRNEGLPVGGF